MMLTSIYKIPLSPPITKTVKIVYSLGCLIIYYKYNNRQKFKWSRIHSKIKKRYQNVVTWHFEIRIHDQICKISTLQSFINCNSMLDIIMESRFNGVDLRSLAVLCTKHFLERALILIINFFESKSNRLFLKYW